MADNEKGEREGLLTTIRARRKWYLGLYFLQIVGWLALVVFNEVSDTGSSDTVLQRIQDSAVTMSFIGQGTLVTTVFLIDVIFDGGCKLVERGWTLMGLIFEKTKNKFVIEGEENADARWNAWITSNPRIKELIAEGEVPSPPKLTGKKNQR